MVWLNIYSRLKIVSWHWLMRAYTLVVFLFWKTNSNNKLAKVMLFAHLKIEITWVGRQEPDFIRQSYPNILWFAHKNYPFLLAGERRNLAKSEVNKIREFIPYLVGGLSNLRIDQLWGSTLQSDNTFQKKLQPNKKANIDISDIKQ